MPIQPKGLLFLFRLCVLPAQYASGYAVGGEGRPVPFGADGPAGAAVHDSAFADVALHECLYAAEYRGYKTDVVCLGGYYPSAYAGMPAFGEGVFGCCAAAVVEYVAVKFERAYRIGKWSRLPALRAGSMLHIVYRTGGSVGQDTIRTGRTVLRNRS